MNETKRSIPEIEPISTIELKAEPTSTDVKENEISDREFEDLKTKAEIEDEQEVREVQTYIQSLPHKKTESPLMPQNHRKNRHEVIETKDGRVVVEFVQKDEIYPAYGYSMGSNYAMVRKDLPVRIKNFVKKHELYHCQDESTWGGRLGSELRANLIPGLKDPLGLAATAISSLKAERLRFYWNNYFKKK